MIHIKICIMKIKTVREDTTFKNSKISLECVIPINVTRSCISRFKPVNIGVVNCSVIVLIHIFIIVIRMIMQLKLLIYFVYTFIVIICIYSSIICIIMVIYKCGRLIISCSINYIRKIFQFFICRTCIFLF